MPEHAATPPSLPAQPALDGRTPAGRRERLVAWLRGDAAFLAAVLVLVAALQTIQAWRSTLIQKDGFTFIGIARELLRDPAQAMRAADQHPGYPAMIVAGERAIGWLAGDDPPRRWALGARLLPWICGLASTWLLWLLARRLFGSRAARIAVVLFATLPLFRRNAADALSDTPCLALYLAAAWCLMEAFARRSVLRLLGTVVAGGCAYLVRPEGLSVAIVAGGLLFGALFRAPTRRFAAISLCVAALALGAVAVPYVLVKGSLTSKKDIVAFVAARLHAAAGEEGAPSGGAELAVTGARLAVGAFHILETHLNDGLRYVLVVPLIAAFFRGRRACRDPAAARVAAALIAFHVLVLALLILIADYVSTRHVMISTALALPWVGAGMLVLGDLLARGLEKLGARPAPSAATVAERTSRPKLLTGVRIAAALTVLIAATFLPRDLERQHATRMPLLAVAAWVRAHTQPGDRVLSTSPFVIYYADRSGKELHGRKDPVPELEDRAAPPPYALAVLERDRCGPDCTWFAAVMARYEAKDEPEVQGGPRQIEILRPRSTP